MDQEPTIDIDTDDDLNGIAIIGCPKCGTETRHAMDKISDGSTIECSCGFTIKIGGDGFAAMQREFDDIKRLLDDF